MVYANYTQVSLSGGKTSIVDGYLGGYAAMFSNKTGIRFQYAPYSVLIDLKTMKVLESGDVGASGALAACKGL